MCVSEFAIVGVGGIDRELIADAFDGCRGHMVGAIGEAADGDGEIHEGFLSFNVSSHFDLC